MLKTLMFTLGIFQVHNYLLFDTETREAVLIDTGKDPEEILRTIEREQLDLKHIFYTHLHIDHIEGHAAVRKAYPDAPAWMHPAEQFWLESLSSQAQMFQIHAPEPPVITGLLQPGQLFRFEHFSVEVRFCPGHSSGGVSYYVKEGPYLFTGDTIFSSSIGRTDFPGGDFTVLMDSIATQILTLPDETILYSGHGPITTVGQERKSNPYVLEYVRS